MTDKLDEKKLELDRLKWLEDLRREDAHRSHDKHDEFVLAVNQSMVEAGIEAVKLLALMNGGAIVAVLGFLAALASRGCVSSELIAGVAQKLGEFALGIAAAAAAMCLSYLVNYFIHAHAVSREKTWDHPWVKDGVNTWFFSFCSAGLRLFTMAVAIYSLWCFAKGVIGLQMALGSLGNLKCLPGS